MQTLAVRTKSASSALVHATKPVPANGSNLRAARVAVRAVLAEPSTQAKLRVGPSDDVHEREADRIAGEVMRMPEPRLPAAPQPPFPAAPPFSQIQRACSLCQEDRSLQRRSSPEDIAEESVQPKSLPFTAWRIQRLCSRCENERLQRFPVGDSPFPSTAQMGTVFSSPSQKGTLSFPSDPRRGQSSFSRVGEGDSLYLQRASLEVEEPETVIQAKPLPSSEPRIQRLCPKCEQERLQRLPTGDSHHQLQRVSSEEQEGDSLQLRRKSLPPNELEDIVQPKTEPVRAARLQRRCAQCEEEGVQRQAQEEDPQLSGKEGSGSIPQEEAAELQASRAVEQSGVSVSPDVEAGIRSLLGGGRPLAAAERGFFESRFQRDFSSVRVHQGSRAAELAASINARAFTLGRDIVFGRGQYSPSTAAGRTLIAHELTHVLQQNRSIRRSKPNWGEQAPLQGAPPATILSSPPRHLQPKLYWEPDDMNGPKTHDAVLGRLRGRNSGNIFVEAPIPHATKAGYGKGFRYGFADLMRVSGHGKRAFGARFTDRGKPRSIPPPVEKYNKNYKRSRSAPRVNDAGELVNIGLGATKVKIADLKPAPANPSGTRGKKQIENYHNGLKYTRDLSNKIAIKKGTSQWDLKDQDLQFWTDITVPERITGSKFQNRQLVVKEFTWKQAANGKQSWKPSKKVFVPPKSVRGHLKLNKAKNGIVQYRWAPSFPFSPATLTAAVKHLGKKAVKPLLRDLHTIEVEKLQGKFRRPAVKSVPGSKLRLQRQKVDPKVNTKVADKFDLKDWNNRRKELGKKFDPFRSLAQVADRRTARFLIDADRDAGDPDGFAAERPFAADKDNIQLVKKLDLWTDTGRRAPVSLLGRLRANFGRTFVAVSNRIHGIRSRLQKLFKGKSENPKPKSYGAVAVRAIWRAAGEILRHYFRTTMAALVESLSLGVKSRFEPKIKAMIDPGKLLAAAQANALDETKESFPELNALLKNVERVRKTVRARVSRFVNKFGKQLDELKALSDKARTFGRVIKVAMVAVQCASPPLFGCLKLLASRAIAALADRVMQWCFIQKKFQGAALSIPFLRKLPTTLAQSFLKALPQDVRDFFDPAPINALGDATTVKPEKCDDTGHPKGSREPTDEQYAYADLMTKMGCGEDRKSKGCAKFQALMDLMDKGDVEAEQLKADEIDQLAPIFTKSDITAEDIKEAARNLAPSRSNSFEDFINEAPNLLAQARGRMHHSIAFNRFFSSKKKAKARLRIGRMVIDSKPFTPEKMAEGAVTEVPIVYRFSEDGFAAGTGDFTQLRSFDCSKRNEVGFRVNLANLTLADETGDLIDTGLDRRRRRYWLRSSDKTRVDRFRKELCSS